VSDPNFANVGLLLHCNGTDASTSFPDSSLNAHTVTAVANAQVDTAQSKWGGASARFDGSVTNDYLSVPYSASFELSNGDFTIEGWVRCEFDATSWGTGDIAIQDLSSGTFAPWILFLQDSGSGTYQVGFEAVNSSDVPLVSLLHGTGFAHNTWVHVAVTRSGSTWRLFANGASPASGSSAGTIKTTTAALLLGGGHAGWLDDIRITKGLARYTSAFTPPTAEFEEGGLSARLAADSMLGAVNLLGSAGRFNARLSDASLLGDPAIAAFTDWTGLLEAVQPVQFVLDLSTPGGTVRVPISSWQATLTTDGECYAGCVVPGALSLISTLEDATAFVISRRAALSGGLVIFVPVINCPLQTLQIDQGPTNSTASLSGYFDEIPANDDPAARYNRTLSGVRSISTYTSGERLRCEIDWLLRPGQRALYGNGSSLVVDYVNFYATSEGSAVQAYMDVGARI
jgi:hypothetical protein